MMHNTSMRSSCICHSNAVSQEGQLLLEELDGLGGLDSTYWTFECHQSTYPKERSVGFAEGLETSSVKLFEGRGLKFNT